MANVSGGVCASAADGDLGSRDIRSTNRVNFWVFFFPQIEQCAFFPTPQKTVTNYQCVLWCDKPMVWIWLWLDSGTYYGLRHKRRRRGEGAGGESGRFVIVNKTLWFELKCLMLTIITTWLHSGQDCGLL